MFVGQSTPHRMGKSQWDVFSQYLKPSDLLQQCAQKHLARFDAPPRQAFVWSASPVNPQFCYASLPQANDWLTERIQTSLRSQNRLDYRKHLDHQT